MVPISVVVRDLPLRECVKFWGDAVEKWTVNEIFDVLSVTGGIPRYLEELSVSLSSSENIRRLCFLPNAVLRTDFDEMFTDVITRQHRYTASVLRHLVDGAKTTTELAKAMNVEKGGRISAAL